MYGIVTTGSEWVFLRWAGDSKNPKIEMTRKISYNITSDFVIAKTILSHIAGVLEVQVNGLFDHNKRIRVRGPDSDSKNSGRKGSRVGRKASRTTLAKSTTRRSRS